MTRKISTRLNKLKTQLEQLEQERKALESKRAQEIGLLAMKHGIDIIDNEILVKAFQDILTRYQNGQFTENTSTVAEQSL